MASLIWGRSLSAIRRGLGMKDVYTLYEAESQGHAKLLWATGDGSTSGLRLTIRNLRMYPITLIIEAGTTFTPEDPSYQQMMAIRPFRLERLDRLETRSIWINTACLQAHRRAPRRRRDAAADYLRQQGLQDTAIDRIVSGDDDEITTHIEDLRRVADALGFSESHIQTILHELKGMQTKNRPFMGYALSPMATGERESLRRILEAVGMIDGEITDASGQASKAVDKLVDTFGQKAVAEVLSSLGKNLREFRETQYVIHLDSALANNVFTDSGAQFAAGEALRIVEFDRYAVSKQLTDPRLSSVVVQYAIWAITDDLGLDECCERIKITGRDAELVGAGVRSLLHRTSSAESGSGLPSETLKEILELFAESAAERQRTAQKRQGRSKGSASPTPSEDEFLRLIGLFNFTPNLGGGWTARGSQKPDDIRH